MYGSLIVETEPRHTLEHDTYVDRKRRSCIAITCLLIIATVGAFLFVFFTNGYYHQFNHNSGSYHTSKSSSSGDGSSSSLASLGLGGGAGTIRNEASYYYTDCSYDSLSQWVECDVLTCQETSKGYEKESTITEKCTESYCYTKLETSELCDQGFDDCDENESDDYCCGITYNVEYNSTDELYYCVCKLDWCHVAWNTTSVQCFDSNSNVEKLITTNSDNTNKKNNNKNNNNNNNNNNRENSNRDQNTEKIMLKDVKLGDYVLSGLNNEFSKVISVIHENSNDMVEMRKLCFNSFISTSTSTSTSTNAIIDYNNNNDNNNNEDRLECITLTYDHLLYINGISYNNLKTAKDVSIGDKLWNNKINNFSEILLINENVLAGYRWIATENGNVIINNVLSSNHVKLHKKYLHPMIDHLIAYYGFYLIDRFDYVFNTNIGQNLDYLVNIESFVINSIDYITTLIKHLFWDVSSGAGI